MRWVCKIVEHLNIIISNETKNVYNTCYHSILICYINTGRIKIMLLCAVANIYMGACEQ